MMRPNDGEREGPRQGRGFSLVEVLIAALLFATLMIAVLGMQYTALDGYVQAREVTHASQAGQRVLDIMQVEAHGWRDNNSGGSRDDLSRVYDGGTPNSIPFANTSDPLLEVATGWTWEPVVDTPVNTQLVAEGANRFCIYVRGGPVDSWNTQIQRVQVAVTYPVGPDSSFGDSCPGSGSDLTDNLKYDSSSSVPFPVYESGARAVFMGSIYRRHRFL